MSELQCLGFLLIPNKLAILLFIFELFVCFKNPSHSEHGFLPR